MAQQQQINAETFRANFKFPLTESPSLANVHSKLCRTATTILAGNMSK